MSECRHANCHEEAEVHGRCWAHHDEWRAGLGNQTKSQGVSPQRLAEIKEFYEREHESGYGRGRQSPNWMNFIQRLMSLPAARDMMEDDDE